MDAVALEQLSELGLTVDGLHTLVRKRWHGESIAGGLDRTLAVVQVPFEELGEKEMVERLIGNLQPVIPGSQRNCKRV